MLGKTVGSYKIIGELGEGGMGAVYLAEHTLMGKQAAVKVLLPRYCAVPEVVRRFFNEAKSASMIKHPGIVDVYDFGNQEDGSAFIVMELLEGEELSDLLSRESRISSRKVALLGRQMAKALAAAHELGIVHRDLKPDNIFLEPDPAATGGVRPKILDFGIAKLGDDLSDSSIKTQTGAIMGTPVYMSPEQCTGAGGVDHRSDIYSLGCIMYQMACGRPPFVKVGAGALIAAHIGEAPTAPSAYEPSIDANLESIIMSTLAKSPDGRPQTMDALANVLAHVDGDTLALNTGSADIPRANTAELFGSEASQSAASQGEVRTGPGFAKTTLSTGAVAMASPPTTTRKARGSIWAGAIVFLMAGAAAAFVFTKDDAEEHDSAALPPIEAATSPANQETVTTPTEETPNTISLTIESMPTGASVYRVADGVKLGTTPYSDVLSRGRGELELRIVQAGFEARLMSIPLDKNFTETLKLTAVSAPMATNKTRRLRRGDKKVPVATGESAATETRPTTAPPQEAPKAEPPKAAPPKAAPPKAAPPPSQPEKSKWGDLAP